MRIKNFQLLRGLILLLISAPAMVAAVDLETVAEGGRAYDKWWVDTGLQEPRGTHPSYPAEGKATGSATWRCKECHGWDYRGRDGAYASGSHYSGITGIRTYADANPAAIYAILVNPVHQYNKVLPRSLLNSLSIFVAQGQLKMRKYIDPQTLQVSGNAKQGRKIFDDNCVKCHGRDGREINFTPGSGKREYVGTIAQKNPWETLHKIRNGQPGSEMRVSHMGSRSGMGMGNMRGGMLESMPAMITRIGEGPQIDLLAYLQTLPRE